MHVPATVEIVTSLGLEGGDAVRWMTQMGFSEHGPEPRSGPQFWHWIGNWGPVLAFGRSSRHWTTKEIVDVANSAGWRGSPLEILREMVSLKNKT